MSQALISVSYTVDQHVSATYCSQLTASELDHLASLATAQEQYEYLEELNHQFPGRMGAAEGESIEAVGAMTELYADGYSLLALADEPADAAVPAFAFLTQTGSVQKLLDAAVAALAHVPADQRYALVTALQQFEHRAVPTTFCAEDIYDELALTEEQARTAVNQFVAGYSLNDADIDRLNAIAANVNAPEEVDAVPALSNDELRAVVSNISNAGDGVWRA